METTPVTPSLIRPQHRRAWQILTLLLGLTAVFAVLLTTLPMSEQIGIRPVLPATIAGWIGEDFHFCQNVDCLRSFRATELNGAGNCPSCGGRLDLVSLPERNLLPSDTVLARRSYHNSRNESFEVTIVLSGQEQKSIHRPEQCLPAQGYAIDSSAVMPIALAGRASLKVRILQARLPGSTTQRMYFVYWFIGGTRETPYHAQRLAWMAWDNLIHGIRSRWAYISIAAKDNPASGVPTEQRLADFIRQLYPCLK